MCPKDRVLHRVLGRTVDCYCSWFLCGGDCGLQLIRRQLIVPTWMYHLPGPRPVLNTLIPFHKDRRVSTAPQSQTPSQTPTGLRSHHAQKRSLSAGDGG